MGVSVTAEGISNILGIKSRSARYSLYLHNIFTLQACFFSSIFSLLSMTIFLLVKIHLIYFLLCTVSIFFNESWNPKLHITVFSRALLHNIYSFKVVRLLLFMFQSSVQRLIIFTTIKAGLLVCTRGAKMSFEPWGFSSRQFYYIFVPNFYFIFYYNFYYILVRSHLYIISIAPRWTFAMNQKIMGWGTGDGTKTD